jgi:hypothetical protein
MQGIIHSPIKRTCVTLFAEVCVAGVWALIDPTFVTENALSFIAIGGSGLVVVFLAERIAKFLAWEKKQLIGGEREVEPSPTTAHDDLLANHVVTRISSINPPALRLSQRDRPAAFRISPEANIGDLNISGSVFIGSGDFIDNQGSIGRMKVDKTIVMQPTGKGDKPDEKR